MCLLIRSVLTGVKDTPTHYQASRDEIGRRRGSSTLREGSKSKGTKTVAVAAATVGCID